MWAFAVLVWWRCWLSVWMGSQKLPPWSYHSSRKKKRLLFVRTRVQGTHVFMRLNGDCGFNALLVPKILHWITVSELSDLHGSVVMCAYIAQRRGILQIASSFVHRSLFAIIKRIPSISWWAPCLQASAVMCVLMSAEAFVLIVAIWLQVWCYCTVVPYQVEL